MKNNLPTNPCLFCNSINYKKTFEYNNRPQGEINFHNTPHYFREIFQCQVCFHYISVHNMDLSNLYSGQYVDSTYSGQVGLKKTFDRIVALASDKSDNYGRVKSINDFAFNFFENKKNHTILDIGSGLGVFPYAMQKLNWECTALDPDPRACEHLKNTVGVKSICADFLKAEEIGQYDCISLNKVLEHVDNPIKMLSKVKKHLKPKGLIYIEVPDGEQSELDGKNREEFFIDHLHIFSLTSLCLLAKKSDLTLLKLERLKEPSTKYTLRAFLTHHGSGTHT